MSESQLYTPIIKAILASGVAHVWRQQSGRVRVRGGWMSLGPEGAPDIVGWMLRGPLVGRFVGLEVKKPGEKPTEKQLEWQAKIRDAGGVCGVVETVGEAMVIVLDAEAFALTDHRVPC
jgi:hypothetical protein